MGRARAVSVTVGVAISLTVLIVFYKFLKRKNRKDAEVEPCAETVSKTLDVKTSQKSPPTKDQAPIENGKSEAELPNNVDSQPEPVTSSTAAEISSEDPCVEEIVRPVNRLQEAAGYTPGQMTDGEARVLISMLSPVTDDNLLRQVLTTVGNAAAFTTDQNTLRQAGALPRLNSLLRAHSMALKVGQSIQYPAVVNGVISSINNMAMNEENQTQLKECIPSLIDFASTDKMDEAIQLASLQALTNLSVKPEYHEPYTKLIQQLYEYLDNGTPNIRLQAMKVLANLSSNVEMVPHLLAAKCPRCLFELLAPDTSSNVLVRWLTILANVMCIVHDTGLTAASLPTEYKAPSPETTYTALYGHNNINKFKSKVFVLSRHNDSDVKHQASRIYGCLT